MKHLFLIRHGETEWNSDRRIQGSVDVPLSAAGREQAAALAQDLVARGLGADRLYTSDLQRSRETGTIIAEGLGIDSVGVSPLLRELHCGLWEGRLIEEIRVQEKATYEAWLDDPAMPIPGGESVLQLRSRVERFFEESRAELDGAGRVGIVAHGLINRMFLSVLLKLDPQRSRYFSQDNTALSAFTWRGGRVYCDFWNLTCHL
jgi:broad specificity phosphatase PhoE